MKCPHCNSEWIVKNGKKNNKQRYYCKDCNCSFYNPVATNSIACTTKTRNLFIEAMLDEKKPSLIDIKENLKNKYTKKTIYNWRTKVLSEILNIQSKTILSGEIQADEIYIQVSYKGNHNKDDFKLPRDPHKRTTDIHCRGISSEKIAVLTAIDTNGSVIAIPISQGRPTSNQIYNALKNNIKPNSTLITDSSSAYNKLAKSLNLRLIQIPSGKHLIEIDGTSYNIQKINNYHKYFRKFLSNFFGVSSKFLIYYSSWFAFIRRTDITKQQKKKLLSKIMRTTDFKPNNQLNKLDPVNLFKAKRKTRN